MDIIAPMLNTSLTFIKILNMYINGKMRILMATIATKTPFFPNNITGKDAIHVIKIELSVISDHVFGVWFLIGAAPNCQQKIG